MSKKGSSSNNHITLSENGEIINDPAKVSEVFNDFFINVAKNIGNTNVIVNKKHPSVCMIKENKLITDDLNFKPVSSNFVSKQINKLNIKIQDSRFYLLRILRKLQVTMGYHQKY